MSLFSVFGSKSAKRTSLHALLELDESRLNDLGLTRYDVVGAMRNRSRASSLLTASRAARAASLAR